MRNTHLKIPAWFFILIAIIYTILGIMIGLVISDNSSQGVIGVIVIDRGQDVPQEEQRPSKMKL